MLLRGSGRPQGIPQQETFLSIFILYRYCIVKYIFESLQPKDFFFLVCIYFSQEGKHNESKIH